MAGALKSYVEKYLLNPAASFNVDDEDNHETKAQVVDVIADSERADPNQQTVSKLRARSAASQLDKDPRYKGKKVLREDLRKDKEDDYDPELAKYFLIDDKDDDGSEEDTADDEEGVVDENSTEGEESSEKEDEMEKKIHKQLQNEPGVRFIDDGDFSKFADDFDEGDESKDEDEDDDAEDEEESDEAEDEEESDDDKDDDDDDDDNDVEKESEAQDRQEDSLKKFSTENQCEEVKKSLAVKNQLALYDTLFEGRIRLQKVMVGTNQLPQFNTHKLFLREIDQHYKKNLVTAKTAAKKLLDTLLHVQEMLLKQNPDTNHIVTGKKPKPVGTESDEEITSSEDDNVEEETALDSRGTKRKMKMEDYEEILAKRHAAMLPFRDQVINKWYEKTKLLSYRSTRGKFTGFDVSALQQLNNILANKHQLIRRTQLTGATRGVTYHVLGKSSDTTKEVDTEEYDPEIFDDTDFYTRALEEVLKAKVSLSDNMTDVSRKWIEIQNLRRKAKRIVDRKASKGRKLRYEVMSKLQQYFAPCCPPRMDDAAINTLFASLFGKCIQRVQEKSS